MTASLRDEVGMLQDLWPADSVSARIRVVIDNDFAGDPDGLFQLAHQVLSPSAQVTQILATPHAPFLDDTVKDACAEAERIARETLELCGVADIPVLQGSNDKLIDRKTPIDSPAARAIIAEAMRTDTDLPLYVTAGAGLGAIASAWLLEPKIADRLTLIWIGGHEHSGLTPVPPGAPNLEYNLSIDPIAGQVIFNDSNINIWQVPRDMYRFAIASRAELKTRVQPMGELGAYLYDSLGRVTTAMENSGRALGEVYVMGDSPLVLLSTLQTAYEPTPASSTWIIKPCPFILDSGLYQENPDGRPLRVFTQLDNRLMFEDLYAKLELHSRGLA
jgi:inosine-uridine nucleoside N-ribohydrolase